MTEIHRNSEDAGRDIDVALRELFRAEMPNPWPAFQKPKATVAPPVTPSAWSQLTWRFALAACIAVLVAGYFTLGGLFPHVGTQQGINPMFNIGQKEKGPKVELPGDVDITVPMGKAQ